MRTKLILFLLLLLTNYVSAQLYNTEESDLKTLEKEKNIRIKNNIKESFEYIRDANSKDSILKSHIIYNKIGLPITLVNFSSKKDTLNYYTFDYSGEKLIKSITYLKKKGNQIATYIRSYSYDNNGNNIAIQSTDSNQKIIYQKIDYNEKSLKKSLSTKWLYKTDFSITEEFFYSKNDDLVETKTYWPSGKLFSTQKFQYDNSKNRISYYSLQNGKKSIMLSYSYNKENNQIEKKIELKSNQYKTTYEYDANNNIVKKCYTVNDILKSTTSIYYKKFD